MSFSHDDKEKNKEKCFVEKRTLTNERKGFLFFRSQQSIVLIKCWKKKRIEQFNSVSKSEKTAQRSRNEIKI